MSENVTAQVTQPLDHARAVMLYPPAMPDLTPLVSLNNRLANEWLTWLRDTAGRRPQTTYNYASCIAMFLDECVGNRALDAVTPQDIDAWMQRPRGGRAKGNVAAPATRARNVAILRSFYKWLFVRGLVSVNVGAMLVAPKVANRQPRAIPDHTWAVAWDTVTLVRMRAILGLGFFLGLRREEIAELRAEHVDTHTRMLRHFPRKGGGDDTFPVGEVLAVWDQAMPQLFGEFTAERFWQMLALLAEHPLGDDGTLLGLPNKDQINRSLSQHLRDCGLKDAFTPHALRHSFVTNLLRCGMPIELVSELANHSNLNVTMRYVKGGGGRVAEWRQQTLASPTVSVSDWR